jgi:hypothetical protein
VSWRLAGFPDDEGRRVRNWAIGKLKAAEEAAQKILDEHPTGLEDPPLDPGRYLNLEDPHWQRAEAQRSKWQALLDGIDQGDAAGFMKAHGEWTRAGTP